MRNHLRSPDEMNWSMTTCAPLAKSPNWASHRVSVVRLSQRVAILEAEHRFFREHRVDDLVAGLILGDVVERRIGLVVAFLVVEHRVTLAERAALDVLARQAHRMALLQQRTECQRFARCPVDALAAFDRSKAIVHEALDRLVDVEALPAPW